MSLGVRGLDFSDGNQRRIARFVFAERVVDRPHLDVTLRPELYASTNTRTDAPYFNPSADGSAALSVDIEHVIWRFYDQSFGQRLVLTGGAYWQENYGTGAIGAARYEQVWRNDPWTEVRYGVEVNRRLYDGVGENAFVLFANLVQRF
jgi:biofilm PGA synthesis protein PgaA